MDATVLRDTLLDSRQLEIKDKGVQSEKCHENLVFAAANCLAKSGAIFFFREKFWSAGPKRGSLNVGP